MTARASAGDRPKRIVIIGAGLAGLAAGHELKRLGHEPTILEAQNRVGGRVYTLRNFAPGLYAEAGAMRIPRTHDLTLEYCRRFGLEMRPFVTGNPKGLVYVGGQRMTMEEATAHPERLPFELADHERGRTADDLWQDAISDIRDLLEKDGDAAWEEIRRRYDQYSLYEFLTTKGFSEQAIEYFAVMSFLESDLNNAVLEVLREDLGKAYTDMQEIVGGMDQLPGAFYRDLQAEVRLGAAVHAIDQDDKSVTMYFKTESGRFSVTADYAICTIPFPVLRTVEVLTPFPGPNSGPFASSTTTRQPKFSFRSSGDSGSQRTASPAALR